MYTPEDGGKNATMWKHFKGMNFGDYHDLYLMINGLLLTDIFETFERQV